MDIRHFIVDALICVSAVLALLAIATAVRKSVRTAMDKRRDRIEAGVRPRLMQLLADDDHDNGHHELSTVRGREGRILESVTASLLSKLRGEDREAVVKMLAARGKVDAARRSLHGFGAVRRARAAEFLGATASVGAYDDLVKVLQGRNAELRGVAARALGRMGDAEAVAPLLDTLEGPHAIPAGIVTMSLLHIGPAAETPLRGELGLAHASPRARQISAELLGVLGNYAAAPELMELANDDPDEEVRRGALSALGRIGHPQAVETLVSCLSQPDSTVLGATAARALGQVGSPQAVPALAAAVRHDDHAVARNSAEALTRLGAPGRTALNTIARSGDTASRYARGAISAADARAVRSGRAA